MIKKILIIAIFTIGFKFYVLGEVYLLRNLFSTSHLSNKSTEHVEAILDTEVIFEDDLIVNGYSTKMLVGNSRYNFGEIVRLLSTIDYNTIQIIDGNTVLISIKVNDKYQKRYLICNVVNSYRAIVFEMQLPLQLPQPFWVGEFEDLLKGAKIEAIVEYPKRKAVYLTFTNVYNAQYDMKYLREVLNSRGFKSISNEYKEMNNLSDIFINYKSNEMICVSFDIDNESGMIYFKKEK